MTDLRELEKKKLLILPGPSSWGGSFSGNDAFYTGDGADLILISADGGNSESALDKIILACRHRGGQVQGRILSIDKSVDKKLLIDFLNQNAGKTLGEIYTIDFKIER